MHTYAGNNVQGQFVDLANRLEHLITYSSQLIFVSGEAMSHQTSFVQRFLGNQNEHANIVYLDASKKIDLPSFRRRIGQQLSRDKPIDLSKPLTESLSRLLTTENEFVLVAVTHAEGLPNDILKELWDLVLQNRFARHRHHLNVLVFGETNWAEGAKSWLPANSNSKPVLLSSETVAKSSDQSLALSDLDELIASKRAEFDKRIAKRKQPSVTSNPLKKWWIKLLIASVFILSFGGILIGQYFDLTKEAVAEFSSFLFQSDLEQVVEHKELVNDILPKQVDESLQARNVTSESISSSESTSSIFNLPQGQVTVTEWKDAIKALPTVPLEVGIEQSNDPRVAGESVGLNLSQLDIEEGTDLSTVASQNELEQSVANTSREEKIDASDTQAATDSPSITSTAIEQRNLSLVNVAESTDAVEQQETAIAEQEEGRVDYPVEDIVSVEQLAQVNIENQQVDSEGGQSEYSPFDNEWVRNLDSASFVLQISAMSSEQVLKQYLADNQLIDRVRVYRIERFGGPWHVVLWDKTFSTIEEARNEVNVLPQSIQAAEPFAKRVNQIKPLL